MLLRLCIEREVVEGGCWARLLNKEDDAMDRGGWRRHIGVIDGRDGCEWVNVASGTGSPWLSWSCKMVVVLVVVVQLCIYSATK